MIADAFCISRSAALGTVRRLRQADMIHARRRDRRHHYMVNLDAPFDHPAPTGYSLRHILGGLATDDVPEIQDPPPAARRIRTYRGPFVCIE